MNFPTVISNEVGKTKSFWEKPEGLTGMLSIGLLGLGGFFVAQAILPALLALVGTGIALVGKTIILTALCAVLASFLYVITNKKFLNLMKYGFKSSMRKLTGWFVEIDPIGIMKGYIESLGEKQEVLVDKKQQLNGQIANCKQIIAKNEKEIEDSMNTFQSAQKAGKAGIGAVSARNAGRLQEFNKKLAITQSKMEMLYRALNKYAEATTAVIADLKSEVKVREEERKMMLTSYSAMSAAMNILRDGSDEKELFDQAMEFVAEDYAKKLGEIEDFMTSSQTILDGIDLQNASWEGKALKQLEAWESKTDSLLLGDDKRLIVENSHSGSIPNYGATAPIAPMTNGGDDFGKFFRNNQ